MAGAFNFRARNAAGQQVGRQYTMADQAFQDIIDAMKKLYDGASLSPPMTDQQALATYFDRLMSDIQALSLRTKKQEASSSATSGITHDPYVPTDDNSSPNSP